MATKRARQPRRKLRRASRKVRRYNPPVFGPWNSHEIRTLAEAVALRLRIDAVSARYVALHALKLWQVEEILKSLGCDPSTPDWRSAFFKLARHFCNVGQVRRARGGGTRKWTDEKESILLREMRRLHEQGLSERQALKRIADNPVFDDVLPYTEQIEVIDRSIRTSGRKDAPRKGWESVEDRPRERRMDALRKVWELLKGRIRSDPKSLERALGLTKLPPGVMRIISHLDIFPEPKPKHKKVLSGNECDPRRATKGR